MQALQEREPGLKEHIDEVAALSRAVGRALDLSADDIDILVRSAELHDIGKVAVPDSILLKPGPLDDTEWGFVRQHTVVGERILSAAPALVPVARIVRASHERWDGAGYPDGTRRRGHPPRRAHRGHLRRLPRDHIGAPLRRGPAPRGRDPRAAPVRGRPVRPRHGPCLLLGGRRASPRPPRPPRPKRWRSHEGPDRHRGRCRPRPRPARSGDGRNRLEEREHRHGRLVGRPDQPPERDRRRVEPAHRRDRLRRDA